MWFKGYVKNKLKLSKAFEFPNSEELFDILVHCSGEFDMPTPVILDKHKKYFSEFSTVKFFKDDFVENLPYDAIELEVFE